LVAVYDVNLSESIDRSLGGAFDRLVIADVADHPSHFREIAALKARDRVLKRVLLHVGEHHAGSRLRQRAAEA